MKTKLGISAGLLGAVIYLSGLFSGYTVLTLLVGYVLLFEESEWLKRTAVKAYTVCICFSLLSALVGFIPNTINLIDAIATVFNGAFYIGFVSNLVDLAQVILSIAEKVLLIVLAYKALNQQTIKINAVDKLIDNGYGPSNDDGQGTDADEGKFCTNCGAKIPGSATFCPHCGNKG